MSVGSFDLGDPALPKRELGEEMERSNLNLNGLFGFANDLSVSKKLAIGFGVVLCVLVALVAFVEVKLMGQDELQSRVIEQRFPTNLAGHDLTNGVNYSLAALRGYMILGKETFKQQRQEAWQAIDHDLSVMTEMSKNWTAAENVEALNELKAVMAEFKTAQQQVENISHTENEQPALKILLSEAAPRASKTVMAITGMINEEKKLEATPERKALLATFADSRGSFAMGLASIRAYLISGDQKWADDFNRRWLVNTARFQTIKQNRYLLTEVQQKYFRTYTDMRAEFAPLPAKMFEIRQSNQWNMANYLLGAEAAPRAVKALAILAEMVKSQNQLVAMDTEILQQESANLKLVAVIATLFALIIGGVVAWLITRMIVTPLKEAMAVSQRIADGDLSGTITVTSNDETGQLLQGMKHMQDKLTQVIEVDVQNLVESGRQGDLTQRIGLNDKQGCYKKLCAGINDLVDVSDNVVSDTVRVFGALAKGDLSETMTAEYQGSFDQLKQDANATISKIQQVIEGDIQSIVDAALAGDLSRRIDPAGKEGFFLKLGGGINELLDTLEMVFDDISDVMSNIAKGDMTQEMSGNYTGMFADVKNNINESRSNLVGVVSQMRDSADQINSASIEISSGNTSLSGRTEQQASALEETASSMEQLTVTVRNNADNAQQANQVAVIARKTAESGGEVVSNAVLAMAEINTSSNKIAEIIGVINEIAFQTNLLALNASVEAARAGDQGLGFAVVATEVRNLAGRSAKAAKEIKELINDSAEKVRVGANLVNESGENLAAIVADVKKVGDLIFEIANSSEEQSEGIGQVNLAVTSMDKITQQNAALAEQTAAASESMSQKAKDMNEMMSFFTVSNSTRAATVRTAITTPSAMTNAAVASVAVTTPDDEWSEF